MMSSSDFASHSGASNQLVAVVDIGLVVHVVVVFQRLFRHAKRRQRVMGIGQIGKGESHRIVSCSRETIYHTCVGQPGCVNPNPPAGSSSHAYCISMPRTNRMLNIAPPIAGINRVQNNSQLSIAAPTRFRPDQSDLSCPATRSSSTTRPLLPELSPARKISVGSASNCGATMIGAAIVLQAFHHPHRGQMRLHLLAKR